MTDGTRTTDTENTSGEWEVNTSILDTEQDDMTNLWTVPYGNLMTMLMIFFMILYSFAYSGKQSTRYEKMVANLQGEMGDSSAKKRGQEMAMAEKLDSYLEKSAVRDYASVSVTAQTIKITLSNPVLFDSGSAGIKESAYPTLNEIASLLAEVESPVVIEGHTDNVPISTEKFRSNFELSAARAFSVIDYFVRMPKMLKERFSCQGYGEFMPVASNSAEEGRAANRRIEITILREEK